MLPSTPARNSHCVALSGGVGGAKLALGLSHLLAVEHLSIIANTADDFEHIGLSICPDLDTIMYTLCGLSNQASGWGQAGETWQFLAALERLQGETWFRLGDRDMATHILRSQMLRAGKSLSEITRHLCQMLGSKHPVIPMTDDRVATQVYVRSGARLPFQHYFVRDRCEPQVTGFHFDGLDTAKPSADFTAALTHKQPGCILICPSNPFVSVDPILKLTGIMALLKAAAAPVIAVSPIVNGRAIKGPAAKMMAELKMPQTALAVAIHYQGRIDGFVIDEADASMASAIEALGMAVLVTPTVMHSLDDRVQLARACLSFSARL